MKGVASRGLEINNSNYKKKYSSTPKWVYKELPYFDQYWLWYPMNSSDSLKADSIASWNHRKSNLNDSIMRHTINISRAKDSIQKLQKVITDTSYFLDSSFVSFREMREPDELLTGRYNYFFYGKSTFFDRQSYKILELLFDNDTIKDILFIAPNYHFIIGHANTFKEGIPSGMYRENHEYRFNSNDVFQEFNLMKLEDPNSIDMKSYLKFKTDKNGNFFIPLKKGIYTICRGDYSPLQNNPTSTKKIKVDCEFFMTDFSKRARVKSIEINERSVIQLYLNLDCSYYGPGPPETK